jgi:MerR family transcriptional regulator, mercuric resistance operon regulatory protein
MAQTVLRIGELAANCGVSIDTIRYYERRRLLLHAGRTAGGFRLFTPEAVERLRFIKQAQEIGFSLDEIGGLLSSGGAAECQRVRDPLRAKLDELDEQIKAMRKFRGTLADHFAACERELILRGRQLNARYSSRLLSQRLAACNLAKAEKTMEEEVRNPNRQNRETYGLSLAAILPALGASLTWFCCLPLAVGTLGAGFAAAGASLAPLRPYLTVVSIALLGLAFYQAYKPRMAECAPGKSCEIGASRT